MPFHDLQCMLPEKGMHVFGNVHPAESKPPGHVISLELQVTGTIAGQFLETGALEILEKAEAKVQKRANATIDFIAQKLL